MQGSQVAFDALVRIGVVPSLVVTLPPRASSRHSDFVDLSKPALAAGSAILHTINVNSNAALEAIDAEKPDFCFVVGWSQVCHESFRAIAQIGSIGFHPGPLPRFRGRAVIPWTILREEETTGSTLFWLDEGIDSGPILLQRTFSVARDETARTLYDKHMTELSSMIPQAVEMVLSGSPPCSTQDHSKASYCAKRRPDDGLIDWSHSAQEILRLIRAIGDPYPGAFTYCAGEKLIVDSASAIDHSGRYIGLAGQVQWHTPSGFLVKCGDDACIEVLAWRCQSGIRPKVHSRLGEKG